MWMNTNMSIDGDSLIKKVFLIHFHAILRTSIETETCTNISMWFLVFFKFTPFQPMLSIFNFKINQVYVSMGSTLNQPIS